MNAKEVEKLLNEVKIGDTSVDKALEILKNFPYTDLGFARIDHHREMRTGYPEIIYCAGKTIDQVREIFRVMSEKENNVIGTSSSGVNSWMTAEKLRLVRSRYLKHILVDSSSFSGFRSWTGLCHTFHCMIDRSSSGWTKR